MTRIHTVLMLSSKGQYKELGWANESFGSVLTGFSELMYLGLLWIPQSALCIWRVTYVILGYMEMSHVKKLCLCPIHDFSDWRTSSNYLSLMGNEHGGWEAGFWCMAYFCIYKMGIITVPSLMVDIRMEWVNAYNKHNDWPKPNVQ